MGGNIPPDFNETHKSLWFYFKLAGLCSRYMIVICISTFQHNLIKILTDNWYCIRYCADFIHFIHPVYSLARAGVQDCIACNKLSAHKGGVEDNSEQIIKIDYLIIFQIT